MRLPSSVTAIALAAACGIAGLAQQPPRIVPGPRPDQSILLPNGWTITPAGQQIALSTLPMSLAVSPDGKHLLTLNAGFLPPSISVIDLKSMQETARVPVEDAWLGLTFHPDGEKVYVGGATTAAVHEFNFQDGILKPGRTFPAVPADKRQPTDFIGEVALSPDGRFLFAANLFRDSITVMNIQSGFVVREIRTGRRPYRILFNRDAETFFVSHWAESSVGLYRIADGQLIERIAVGPHPTDLGISNRAIETPEGDPPIVARLFVASAHTNHVESIGITGGNRFQPLEWIPVSPTPTAPLGSLPTALALSADGNHLYMVASGNNAIVMADISAARAELIAAIPTGWFPTAVAELPAGGLAYLSGKGSGSRPNPNGPDPTRRGASSDYIAALETGSLGILPSLAPEILVPAIRRVIANSPYGDSQLAAAGVPPGNPIPNRPGDPSPIEHVIYIIKENRSFDQIFGDFDGGAGEKNLVVFNNDVTPNHRKLAREFALLDNFYAAGSVSADGYSWSAGALANDYVEKLWPSYQARRRGIYDFEGVEPAAIPPAGYLWTNALDAGLSVRNYGIAATRGPTGATEFSDPALTAYSQPDYPPFDLDIPDTQRVDVFLKDFNERQAAGALPKLMLVRLPSDHTAGREPAKRTARAMVADNDYALGRLVEAVSKSAAWAKTAIFIVEDDAQDGADHIDSHRAPALVVSPYSRGRGTDSTFYSSPSVLRTIELILGLRPMTQFDAAATPLFRSFGNEADPRPYEAVEPAIDLNERNPDGAGGRSRRVELHIPFAETPKKSGLSKALAKALAHRKDLTEARLTVPAFFHTFLYQAPHAKPLGSLQPRAAGRGLSPIFSARPPVPPTRAVLSDSYNDSSLMSATHTGPVHIGIVGLGNVGRGTLRILHDNAALIQRKLGFPLVVSALCSRSVVDNPPAEVALFPNALLTANWNQVVEHPDVQIVVELVGGMDAAAEIIDAAMARGKSFVTANKELMAERGGEIWEKAIAARICLAMEASVAGGIPIHSVLREGISGDRVASLLGILNGTSNYILTEMEKRGAPLETVLKEAQDLGYAEADPTADIDGYDARSKLALLAALAFGVRVTPSDIHLEGIRRIRDIDFAYASRLGQTVRLIAAAEQTEGGLLLSVRPALIPRDTILAHVQGSYNAIWVRGVHGEDTFYYGRGAGPTPTGVAVVSDLMRVARELVNGSPERVSPFAHPELEKYAPTSIENQVRAHYLRFRVRDRPGIIAALASILADAEISLDAVLQEPSHNTQDLPFVITIEPTRQGTLREAVARMETLDFLVDKPLILPLENGLQK